jgi:GrpB-like predicted nucleotidyltransferase (UPF0157 family)
MRANAMLEPESAVTIEDYNSEWPRLFERYAAELRASCGPRLAAIEHVGSTAVEGLAAKPIVDMIGLVDSEEDGAALIGPIEALGYVYRGEQGIPGRFYFRYREAYQRHLHVFPRGSAEAEKMLLFRDRLRAVPALAASYAAEKRRLASEFPDRRAEYTEAKTPFITRALRDAGYTGPVYAGADRDVRAPGAAAAVAER